VNVVHLDPEILLVQSDGLENVHERWRLNGVAPSIHEVVDRLLTKDGTTYPTSWDVKKVYQKHALLFVETSATALAFEPFSAPVENSATAVAISRCSDLV